MDELSLHMYMCMYVSIYHSTYLPNIHYLSSYLPSVWTHDFYIK